MSTAVLSDRPTSRQCKTLGEVIDTSGTRTLADLVSQFGGDVNDFPDDLRAQAESCSSAYKGSVYLR